MEKMKIDFTGVEGQKSFEPIPGGKYLVEVTDYRTGNASENAKNPGAPTISWMLTVDTTATGEEFVTDKRTGLETKVTGRTVWENMTIVENSFWRLKSFLEACGFDVEGEIDFDPDEVLNSQLVVKVGVQKARKDRETGEEYEARNVIRSFHPVEETV
jgi:hypothetical protein